MHGFLNKFLTLSDTLPESRERDEEWARPRSGPREEKEVEEVEEEEEKEREAQKAEGRREREDTRKG